MPASWYSNQKCGFRSHAEASSHPFLVYTSQQCHPVSCSLGHKTAVTHERFCLANECSGGRFPNYFLILARDVELSGGEVAAQSGSRDNISCVTFPGPFGPLEGTQLSPHTGTLGTC